MSKKGSWKRVCLAYSGGLDTSVILKWLAETYRCPIVAFVADIGQVDDLSGVEKKALATGAQKCVIQRVRNTAGWGLPAGTPA